MPEGDTGAGIALAVAAAEAARALTTMLAIVLTTRAMLTLLRHKLGLLLISQAIEESRNGRLHRLKRRNMCLPPAASGAGLPS